MRVERLLGHPIITSGTHPSIGKNIQGPSLIRVPDWVKSPLGRYYLYFADHKGSYIRLAYADRIDGPWQVHPPGSLQLKDSQFPTEPPVPKPGEEIGFTGGGSVPGKRAHSAHAEASTPHIASPDVHVNENDQCIVMYFHGLESYGKQATRVAVSQDGINFSAKSEILGRTYFRVFEYEGYLYALAMPGQFYRSRNRYTNFEMGPLLFNQDMRHSALFVRDGELQVFWTQVGLAPETIMLSTIDLSGDWMSWKETAPVEVLRPEHDWEGADAPLEPSIRSTAYGHVNQLRDPAVYIENGMIYLLYAVAGESGIAAARIELDG
ncbi:MAG: hypothetical protein VW802_02410 [Rhodospirillaceae bacterium]|jgi:hypothetical protein